MNYKKIRIAPNIKRYEVCNGNLLCIEKDGAISLNGDNLLEPIFFSVAFFRNSKTIVYGNPNTLIESNLDTNTIKKLNPKWSYYWPTYKDDEIMVSMNYRKTDNGYRVADYYRYNFLTEKLLDLKLTEVTNFFIHDNNGYFLYDNVLLRKRNLSTGEQLWEIQLDITTRNFTNNERNPIKQVIGIHQNQFLVSFASGHLLGISTKTGEVLWHSDKFLSKDLLHNRSSLLGTFSNWHLQDGKLYQFDGDTYFSFDIDTGETQFLWQDEREKNYITVINKNYTNNYIYFAASLNQRLFPTVIGIFDRTNLSITWVHEVEQVSRCLNAAPQVDGNKLYVLDGGGSLHIFEAEG
jgi:outer membrane protein assembly factor BamB